MVQQGTASERRPVTFGRFRLDPTQQQLFEANQAVRIGGRAFEILTALVEQAGELVSKDELMARVWPNATADDGALRVHVAALRRTLGDGQGGNRFIINVPGRGYRFVAPVSLAGGPAQPEPVAAASRSA